MNSTYNQLEVIRDNALEMLSPFGFTGNDDDNPAELFHRELGMTFDMSASDPHKIILIVAKAMQEKGYKQAQSDIRKSLGINAE